MRSPFLQGGGDNQFNMLQKKKFLYDSSFAAHYNDGIWPYTLDYVVNGTQCGIEPCPKTSHEGIWQVPILPIKKLDGVDCNFLDTCIHQPDDTEEVFQILYNGFIKRYNSTKAPYLIYLHAECFKVSFTIAKTL